MMSYREGSAKEGRYRAWDTRRRRYGPSGRSSPLPPLDRHTATEPETDRDAPASETAFR